MIRVLQIICAIGNGGIEQLLYQYCSRMDPGKIVFDFAVNEIEKTKLFEDYQKYCGETGGQILQYTKMRKNPFRSIKDLQRIIDMGKYDIVHSHLAERSFPVIWYAKKKKGLTTISHAHAGVEYHNPFIKVMHVIGRSATKRWSDYLFACGEVAGICTWGEKCLTDPGFHIMKNAIDPIPYQFSEEKRRRARKKINLDHQHVIICVGRLTNQKNQMFLLDVFREYLRYEKDSILLLVGDGEDRQDIERRIKQLEIEKSVILLGIRSDVGELLCAADCMVLPSFFEGFPISVVEAAAAGLGCVLSDRITKEVKLTDGIIYCSLEDSVSKWCQSIRRGVEYTTVGSVREEGCEMIRKSGYEIQREAGKMQEFYLMSAGQSTGV